MLGIIIKMEPRSYYTLPQYYFDAYTLDLYTLTRLRSSLFINELASFSRSSV